MPSTLPDTVTRLREQHETFYYRRCAVCPHGAGLRLEYHFSITPGLEFSPHLVLPLQDPTLASKVAKDPTVQRLAFLIGMVELLSYWKLCCPPQIVIAAGHLDHDELVFWETLIRKGLGEFFFINQIPPTIKFSLVATGLPDYQPPNHPAIASREAPSTLVLVGGGKDSIVTLELMRRSLPAVTSVTASPIRAFALNPIPASLNAIRVAQYPAPLVATRTIDQTLLALNTQGYLNGHTPFSALLAFVATLTAYINGYHRVVASNEASASEGNTEYLGFEINHQYSKSYEFEQDFRRYSSRLNLPVEYLSFLRPLNELQICGLFSGMAQYHSIFRSCNREQTRAARARAAASASDRPRTQRQGWCADCPKCVFTFLCLRCFLPQEQLNEIFGTDPRTQPHFLSLLSELAGFSEHKPFECVGTYEEVRACLAHLSSTEPSSMMLSDKSIALQQQVQRCAYTPWPELLARWNADNFLDATLQNLLHNSLTSLWRRNSQ